MTLKEAVIKSLEDVGGLTNYSEVLNHIVAQKYFDFGAAKTPDLTVSASFGDFIRNGDTRVKRRNYKQNTSWQLMIRAISVLSCDCFVDNDDRQNFD